MSLTVPQLAVDFGVGSDLEGITEINIPSPPTGILGIPGFVINSFAAMLQLGTIDSGVELFNIFLFGPLLLGLVFVGIKLLPGVG